MRNASEGLHMNPRVSQQRIPAPAGGSEESPPPPEVERRREALAYSPKRKGTLGDDDAGETMEDYFGTKAEDFELLARATIGRDRKTLSGQGR